MDIVGSVLNIIIVFVIVLCMITLYSLQRDFMRNRKIMNEIVQLIDVVTDSGTLSESRLRDFHLSIAEHGILSEINITRFISVINPAPDGGIQETYIPVPFTNYFNKTDIIQVKVTAVELSTAQRLLGKFFRFPLNSLDITLAGMVRH